MPMLAATELQDSGMISAFEDRAASLLSLMHAEQSKKSVRRQAIRNFLRLA